MTTFLGLKEEGKYTYILTDNDRLKYRFNTEKNITEIKDGDDWVEITDPDVITKTIEKPSYNKPYEIVLKGRITSYGTMSMEDVELFHSSGKCDEARHIVEWLEYDLECAKANQQTVENNHRKIQKKHFGNKHKCGKDLMYEFCEKCNKGKK